MLPRVAAIFLLFATTISVTASASVTRIPLPKISADMTVGPDGNLWIGYNNGGSITRFDPDTGALSTFPAAAFSHRITAGPDGAVWYTAGRFIGRMAPDGTETLFPVGNPPSTNTMDVASGGDGSAWFGMIRDSSGFIGRMTTSGAYTLFPHTPAVFRLTRGGDGNIWFTDSEGLWKITSDGIKTFIRNIGTTPEIGTASDGSVWVFDRGTIQSTSDSKLVRVQMNGTVTEHPIAEQFDSVSALAFPPDDSIWFATSRGVGRIDAAGVTTLYPIASGLPQGWGWTRRGLAVAAGGRIWIAQHRTGFALAGQPPMPSIASNGPELVSAMPADLALLGAAPIPTVGTVAQIAIVLAVAAIALWRMRIV